MLVQTSRVLDEILRLDPERDHQRISFLSICYDFPWDTTRSLELALFRTYCVPRMTRILVSTGEFTQRAQKRYDDTVLILAELLEYGYDSERGRAAMRIMNRLHSLYPIENVDFLYTLSTLVFEPVRWNARFGWRPLSTPEKLAGYYYWREVGRRMNIKDIPPTYEAFEQFNRAYERDYFQYGDTNRHIADRTLEVFLSWYPRVLSPLVAGAIYAMLDEPVRAAHNWPRPAPFSRFVVESGLKARAVALRVVATFSGLLALNYGWSAFSSARDVLPEHAAEQVRQAMALLPRTVFPHTAAVAAEMADYGSDRHYELVLDQLLRGVETNAPL